MRDRLFKHLQHDKHLILNKVKLFSCFGTTLRKGVGNRMFLAYLRVYFLGTFVES